MMKTAAKVKTVRKPGKTSGIAKTAKQKKASVAKYVPGEDEIREKAREIYYERIARGEHGTPEGDWKEAEELLKGS
jgi:hypothetical protein